MKDSVPSFGLPADGSQEPTQDGERGRALLGEGRVKSWRGMDAETRHQSDTAVIIKAAEIERRALQAFNLRDLEGDAERVVAQARVHADEILAQARRDADSLREQTRVAARDVGLQEGFEKGHAEGRLAGEQLGREEGLRKAAEEFKALHTPAAQMLGAGLTELERKRLSLIEDAQKDLLKLAVAIGEKLARRSFELDPARVAAQLRAAIDLVADRSAVEIFVNDADLDCVRELLPEVTRGYLDLKQVRVHADAAMKRGDVRITTSRGSVAIELGHCAQDIAQALLSE
ncbi:MAG: hypothetical protein IT462_12305 [Planctomycetes bacterium]|nr:hypothetical protein [Planctomycetota bacterium]